MSDEQETREAGWPHSSPLYRKLLGRPHTTRFPLPTASLDQRGTVLRMTSGVEDRFGSRFMEVASQVVDGPRPHGPLLMLVVLTSDADSVEVALARPAYWERPGVDPTQGTSEDDWLSNETQSDEEIVAGAASPFAMHWHTHTGAIKVLHWCTASVTKDLILVRDDEDDSIGDPEEEIGKVLRMGSVHAMRLDAGFDPAEPRLDAESVKQRAAACALLQQIMSEASAND